MFQLRNFKQIALAMINHARATQTTVTDFNVGSVARTLIEAPAIELDEFYQLVLAGILDAIPVAVYSAFSFNTIAAIHARGVITINFSLPVMLSFTIPAGTIYKSNTNTYTSEAAVVVPLNATTVSFYAVCDRAGIIGNAGIGTITGVHNYQLPNTATITNLSAFVTGQNKETDAERISRFNDYLKSLVRGTPFSVLFAARTVTVLNNQGQVIDYVSRYGIDESPGHVYIYIWGSGGVPSSALLLRSQAVVDGYVTDLGEYVPGYRPAGMRVEIVAMSEQPVDIHLLIKLFAGFAGNSTMRDLIATALESLMTGVVSGTVLFAESIIETALSVSGVHECYLVGNANIPCEVDKVMVMGTFVVEYI